MESDLWTQAAALFLEVVDLSPEDRDRHLDVVCRDEPELRSLVERLLRSDVDRDTLLDEGADVLAEFLDEDATGQPDTFGSYRVLGELGRGGMGTVYLGERADGRFDRTVAIKVVRGGFDSPENLARFESEVHILAGLEHPGIARLYDADVEGERPYLVMEHVQGDRIDRFCDEAGLDVHERVQLFREVCAAVHFAHQNLVIHRDLKPSNILVTSDRAVKLLDFGIAKLTQEGTGADETLTRRAFTPGYASPEQLRGRALSTVSDVYSLGIVLYEILTGRRPFEAPPGDLIALAERTSKEPSSPSAAVSRPFEASTGSGTRETVTPDDIAASRGVSAKRLRRELQGDLDHIVLKALRSDPGARYASVEALGEDLARYLAGRPVSARADSWGYRVRKYAQRHRAGLSFAGIAALLLVGFSVVYTIGIATERDLAQAEAEKARTTTEFLQRLLGDAYPSVALGDTFSMGELLGRAVTRVDSLESQPEIQAELLRTLGDVYREQGRFEEALPLLERAVAVHRGTLGAVDASVVRALDALGHLHYEAHSYDDAFRVFEESLLLSEQIGQPDDSVVLSALNNVAAAAAALGDHEAALESYEAILVRHGRLFPDTSQLVYVTRNNLGQLYHEMGAFADAERELREGLRLRRLALPPGHPSVGLAINNVAEALRRMDRLEEAEQLHREALEIFRRVYGPEHHRVGLSAFNLAGVLRRRGRLDESERYFRLALEIDQKAYGERHSSIGVDLRSLGLLLVEKGDCEGAVATLRGAESIFEDNEVALTHRRRLTARAGLARCLTTLGSFAEAEGVLLTSADAVRVDPAAADSAGAQQTVDELIALYKAWGRPAAADSVSR